MAARSNHKYVAAVVQTDLECEGPPYAGILPLEAVVAAGTLVSGDDVRLSLSHGRAVWRMSNGDRFSHRLVKGTYPDVAGLLNEPPEPDEPRPEMALGVPLVKLGKAHALASRFFGGMPPVRMRTAGAPLGPVHFTIGDFVTGAVMPVRH